MFLRFTSLLLVYGVWTAFTLLSVLLDTSSNNGVKTFRWKSRMNLFMTTTSSLNIRTKFLHSLKKVPHSFILHHLIIYVYLVLICCIRFILSSKNQPFFVLFTQLYKPCTMKIAPYIYIYSKCYFLNCTFQTVYYILFHHFY